MPKLTAAALKARIELLQKQLAAAEAGKGPAIAKVRALMKKLGVTVEDLTSGLATRRRGKASPNAGGTADQGQPTTKPRQPAAKVPVKYRDAEGNTWTGRGKTPRWLVEAESSGKTRESFKVN